MKATYPKLNIFEKSFIQTLNVEGRRYLKIERLIISDPQMNIFSFHPYIWGGGVRQQI